MPWDGAKMSREILLDREWLVTNGLGGYASGTISGAVTRRYHGLLIAALPAPLGRVVMLNHLAEYLRLPDGRVVQFGGEEPGGTEAAEEEAEKIGLRESQHLNEFARRYIEKHRGKGRAASP